MKLFKISFLIYPSNEVEKGFSVLTLLSAKLHNALTPNSLDMLMQSISLEPHTDVLDWGKKTDFD